MTRRSWLTLLVLASIWGASYMLIKIGIRDLSPAVVAWARIVLAALVLVPFAAARGVLRVPARRAGILVLLGAVQVAAPFWLITAGEEHITSSLAGILVASAPLFTALLAFRFDPDERSEGLRLLGVLLGLLGVGLLLGVDLAGSTAELLGGAAVLLAGLGYALGGFLMKRKLGDIAPTGIAAWVMVAGSLLLLPAAMATAPTAAPGLGPLAAVAALGVIGTGLAFVLFYELMKRVGIARTFTVTYLAPAFAVAYGVTLLGEPFTPAMAAGLAAIVGGSYLAVGGGEARSAAARSAGATR